MFHGSSRQEIMKPLNIRTPWMDLQRITVTQAALFHLFTSISLAGGQSGSGSGMVGTTSSSLFVASKDLSTSGWEQYKTESLPSEDLSQCLARCMLHQNQWWNGLHSGWVKYSYASMTIHIFSDAMQSPLDRMSAKRLTSCNSRKPILEKPRKVFSSVPRKKGLYICPA